MKNLPNIITSFRFLLIPAFVYIFFSDMYNKILLSSMIFILAGLTDILDGYIARRYKLVTRLGIVLDPLADKLMLIAVLLSITIRYHIPLWIIAIVVVKELLMIMGAIALYNDHDIVVPANKYGKITTILSYVAILAVNFNLPYNRWLLNTFIVVTIIALTVYLSNFISIKKQHKMNTVR